VSFSFRDIAPFSPPKADLPLVEILPKDVQSPKGKWNFCNISNKVTCANSGKNKKLYNKHCTGFSEHPLKLYPEQTSADFSSVIESG